MLAVEVLFPTSPNWYSSHVADVLSDGTVAVATNQAVTFFAATSRQVSSILPLRSRVTGVALADGVVAACCTDRVVHSYRLELLENLGFHKEHHAEPSALIIVKGSVISGDKRGTLCIWVPGAAKKVERMVPQKDSVICLSANSVGTHLAVGYHSGNVAVVDLESRVFLCFRLRASVQSLSWIPGENGLVSACQDQSVQLWRLPSELAGAEEPSAEQQISPAAQSRDDSKNWICVCALSGSMILFSGSRGELFCWEEGRKPSRAAPLHTRPIFGMKAVGSDHVLTAGMDRFIVLWSTTPGAAPQMKWRFCCLGGHVTAVRADANIACIGCGDNSLRVMDLMHREHRQHCWVAWKGLRTAVTCLASSGRGAWGYGLQDGSFGVLAVNASDGPGPAEPLCTRSHPSPVSDVCWMQLAIREAHKESQETESRGPKKGKKDCGEDCRSLLQGLGLLSLSTGRVLLTPVGGSSSVVQLLPLAGVPAQPCAAALWPLAGKLSKRGEEVLVIAAMHKAGETSVETNSFQFFCLAEGAEDLRCMGLATADGLDGGVTKMSLCATSDGPTCGRLACGTSKGGLAVFHLQWPPSAASAAAAQAVDGGMPPAMSPEALVRCHSKAVVDVQWRPGSWAPSSQESQLLSAGQDGSVKVWSLEFKPTALKLRSNANPTSGALLAACWDASGEESAVLAGGRDQIAFRWLPEAADVAPVAVPMHMPKEKEAPPSQPRVSAARVKAATKAVPKAASTAKEKSSLLSQTSAALYQQSSKARAMELARVALEGDDDSLWPGEPLRADSADGTLLEAVFINRQSLAEQWLQLELSQADGHRAWLLQTWADEDVEPELGAPPVSAAWLWAALARDRNEALAQLVANDAENIHHRVVAALALGRLEDAVGLYLSQELLAEALLLARLRLPSRHPLVLHIYRGWAQDFQRRGRQDQSALCFFATKELGKAMSQLEDWLALPRAPLGPDPLRLAAAFAAAKAAARLKVDGMPDGRGQGDSEDDADYDATLAFDHRSWWGRPELRAAVQAWKRCIVEALHMGDACSALRLARVGPLKRALTEGERFLRGALAGYASAMAWWVQLQKQPEAESPTFSSFLESASLEEEVDWDFEWRALTWLPAYAATEDPLLCAAVELGRGCASLASGGRGDDPEAPWTHLLTAMDALMRGASTALQSMQADGPSPAQAEGFLLAAEPLRRLAGLRRPGESSPRDMCVKAVADLTAEKLRAAGRRDEDVKDSNRWDMMGRVLFGRPDCSLSDIFFLGFGFSRLKHSNEDPLRLDELRSVVRKLPLEAAPDAWLVAQEIQQAVLGAAAGCGLQGVAVGVQAQEDVATSEMMIKHCVSTLQELHSTVPGLVPLAFLGWRSRWSSQSRPAEDLPEYMGDEEPEVHGPAAVTLQLLAALAELLDAPGAEPPSELLGLEAFPGLCWAQRLALLRGPGLHSACDLLAELR
ncbi:unnamed protein product [Effrenium voratum]|uniref:Gem-associated protein 5 TPR domain-containing protein n=1 Tax=Effrenium voratum TaxID=2562239 RepID=A0AA36JL07_9DINO|nr:unnamed protein product [Effrenium voratum]